MDSSIAVMSKQSGTVQLRVSRTTRDSASEPFFKMSSVNPEVLRGLTRDIHSLSSASRMASVQANAADAKDYALGALYLSQARALLINPGILVNPL